MFLPGFGGCKSVLWETEGGKEKDKLMNLSVLNVANTSQLVWLVSF